MTTPSEADKIADAVGRDQHGLWLPIWIIDACDGDLNAARMLAQLLYWFAPDKRGQSKGGVIRDERRWIAKRHDEWWDEIRLSESQAKRAAETLRGLGLVDVDHFRFNGIRTVHYARRSDEIAAAVSAEPRRPKRAEVRLPESAEVRRPLTDPTAQPTADLVSGANDTPPPAPLATPGANTSEASNGEPTNADTTPPPVPPAPPKRQRQRQPKAAPKPKAVQPPEYHELRAAIAEACKVNLKTAETKTHVQIDAAAKALLSAGASTDTVKASMPGWYANDWRGKQGQAPTISQLRDHVGAALLVVSDPEPESSPYDLQAYLARKAAREAADTPRFEAAL